MASLEDNLNQLLSDPNGHGADLLPGRETWDE